MRKTPITRYGYSRLIGELAHLRRVVRPQVIEELQDARAYGLRLDNQQYMHARERHAILQRRIQDIESKLSECEVVVGRKFYIKRVGFDTRAVVQNVQTGDTREYRLVGPYESDVSHGRLSVESPVGRGLMNHGEGDEVVVDTPAGTRIFRIVEIHV